MRGNDPSGGTAETGTSVAPHRSATAARPSPLGEEWRSEVASRLWRLHLDKNIEELMPWA